MFIEVRAVFWTSMQTQIIAHSPENDTPTLFR